MRFQVYESKSPIFSSAVNGQLNAYDNVHFFYYKVTLLGPTVTRFYMRSILSFSKMSTRITYTDYTRVKSKHNGDNSVQLYIYIT